MMRVWLMALAISGFGALTPAQARVTVQIDLSAQRMYVQSSSGAWTWPISSGRSGFGTPGGSYAPTHLARMHYSRKYNMAPMPHAIFFRGGYAIHGTSETGALGRPASHGCVRLSPGNAAALFAMVQGEGARISISGSPAGATRFARMPDTSAEASAPPARMRLRQAAARSYRPRVYYGTPVYYPGTGGWQYGVPAYGYDP